MKGRFLAVVVVCAALAGCASMQANKAPDADLGKLRNLYVAKLSADERGIEELISNRLNAMGYHVTTGAYPTFPMEVDAVVTYQDRWLWDITMYMTRLSIQIRDGHNGEIIANGESMRTSWQRRSPERVVEEVLTEILKQ